MYRNTWSSHHGYSFANSSWEYLSNICVYNPVFLLHCGCCCSPTSLLHQLAHHPCSHRGILTGLGHHCVARGDRRCNLPGQQVKGEIPGADQASYTHNTTTQFKNIYSTNITFTGFNLNTWSSHPLPQGSVRCSWGSPCGPSGCSQWCGGARMMQRSGNCMQSGEYPQFVQMLLFYL